MKNIVIWGALGQAKVLEEFIHEEYNIVAVVDRNRNLISPFTKVPICYNLESLEKLLKDEITETYFTVAIAGVFRGQDRWEIHEKLVHMGLIPVNLIHPTSYVATNSILKEGNQILTQAVLGADVKIGSQCIINTSASVDHESILGNGVHICPGAYILGSVCIEDFVTVGAGAVILPNLNIGKAAVIGAGAVILQDVPPKAVVVGNPGKIIKYI